MHWGARTRDEQLGSEDADIFETDQRRIFRRVAARSHPDVQTGSVESFRRVVDARLGWEVVD